VEQGLFARQARTADVSAPVSPDTSRDLNAEIAGAAAGANAPSGNSQPIGSAASASADRLYSLLQQNPSSPSVAAAFLRYADVGWRGARRLASVEYFSNPLRYSTFDMPRHQEEFLQTAAKFESVDPGNAFFPAMEAIGNCLAANDSGALASLSRAASAAKWHDYDSDEIEGQSQLHANYGDGQVADHARIPNNAAVDRSFRDLAHYMSADAAARDQRGTPQAGLDLRKAMLSVGCNMFAHSTLLQSSQAATSFMSFAVEVPSWRAQNAAHPIAGSRARSSAEYAFFESYAISQHRPDVAALAEQAKPDAALVLGLRRASGKFFQPRTPVKQTVTQLLACMGFWLLVIWFVALVLAYKSKVPYGGALTNTVLVVAPIVLSLVVMAFCACVVLTARAENAALRSSQQRLNGEGAYYAAKLREPWPQ
jgi:hypothetical protein